jgi:hypothetical protein
VKEWKSDGVLLDNDGFPGALVLQLLWAEGLSLLLGGVQGTVVNCNRK